MVIKRKLEDPIRLALSKKKVVILFGARQVGKTTLIREVLKAGNFDFLEVQGDDQDFIDVFSSMRLVKMSEVVGSKELLFIDEAQSIPNIGESIKILHDARPELKIILTGSSSFELANRTQEPLTGRTLIFHLHPLSVSELLDQFTPFEIRQRLPLLLRFGFYPEVFSYTDLIDKIGHLKVLSEAYLYRDILQLTDIRHTDVLFKLLKMLAFQVGNLVSIKELSNQLDISFETVRSYIELLEHCFVLTRLSGFSKNPRKEISKSDKVYFNDIGIRNAVINNFSSPNDRMDIGALWENFLFIERSKRLSYTRDYSRQYFWRKYSGVEIDYVEEKDGVTKGFEFKWSKRKSRAKASWVSDYPSATYELINRENFFEFVV